ncbi:MAG: DUF4870 domain-containing protein [Planctomycetota bacterium]|nr:MAG: DUF4870 domain-containing protein [Planctomycetota bacterium]REJ95584.1 MAG: DUF4870 domain-containing protein [Planctomycetota bacterium]REK22005.1 MAG: DUF4870 domain-containing protein [Planctomycetota bacterium]REK31275.1 MAG: DUF4870 domain-containing protein [Planctomycetota bacterium]
MPSEHDKQSRTWAMAIHLSQFANFIVPTAGIIAPIVLWQMKKDEFPELEEHGKNVTNWLISSLIYAVVSGVLTIVFVGFLLLLVLIVLGVVYPIIGGIKANNGETWKYPGAIAFLK